MSYDKMDSSAVYALFEEIKSKLDKKKEQAPPAMPVVLPEEIAGLKEMSAILREVTETVKLPQKHIHQHRIDLMSNKLLGVFALAVILIIILAYVVGHQWEAIRYYKDNDLKYRYIQMKGEAAPEDVSMLREVFEFNRDPGIIKEIRSRVEKYEQLVKEQAETEARARLNAQQATQIRQKAESVKSRK